LKRVDPDVFGHQAGEGVLGLEEWFSGDGGEAPVEFARLVSVSAADWRKSTAWTQLVLLLLNLKCVGLAITV
jgi:hypothetical protein